MWKRIVIAAVSLAIGLSVAEHAVAAQNMSVQVRKGEVRSSPSFLGNVVATVDYGESLAVLDQSAGWAKVSIPSRNVSGWIHSSALTAKRLTLAAGEKDANVAASGGELALAGKGFNAGVESEFKTRNPKIDFTWVDRMEKIKVPMKEMQDFVRAGAVGARKGGAQ
jgi:hypothetical protein